MEEKYLPLVSVLMPAYNHEEYIAESIESVINQTFKDWELIVINDGSKDRTLQVICKYADQYPEQIRLINKEKNEGTVAGLNDGLKAAKGQYIGWLSSDDVFFNDTIERQVSFLRDNPNFGFMGGGAAYIDEKGVPLGIQIENWSEENIYHTLLVHCCLHGCSVLTRRECYEKVGLFDGQYRYAHEYDMWLRLAANFNIGYLPQAIVKGRVHSRQITKLGRNEIDAINVSMDFLKNEHLSQKLLQKAGLNSGWEGWMPICKQIYDYYRPNEKELETIANAMDKLSCSFIVPLEQKDEYELLKKHIQRIIDNPVIENSGIFLIDNRINFMSLICNAYNLNAFIINKQAIRFDRYQTCDIQTIFRGIPHKNTLVIIEVPGDINISALQSGTYQFLSEWNKAGVNKIGISSFMLNDPQFSELLKYPQSFIKKQIREIVYEEILRNYF